MDNILTIRTSQRINRKSRRHKAKTNTFETRIMSKFYSCVRQRHLCLLTIAFIFFVNSNVSHAFAPTPNQLSFVRSRSGPSQTKSRTPTTGTKTSRRKNKTMLSALPIVQLATQASSAVPKSLLLMKDASGPLTSVLTADPDAEAQFLLDISHIFLDFTAFFKFDGRFLNYAQLVGRISFILIDFLPGHAFHIEEMAIQLFFLGINLQKIMPDFQESSSSSSTSISPDEIELQQQLHSRPLLPEETIETSYDCQDDEEEEEISVVTWEEIEVEMNKRLL